MEDSVLFEDLVQPAATWSHVLKRRTALRITDIDGGANASAVFYNWENPVERYNMPDTLKAQHIARITRGCVLYSDVGRILCSVSRDTVGWHDPISGCSNAVSVKARYGEARYQEHRNDCYKNAYDSFVIELAKYGLAARNLAAPINFFSKVTVDESGGMKLVPGSSKPGMYVELRAEMNVLVVLNTCQHPLDPNPNYEPRPVHLSIRQAAPLRQTMSAASPVRRMPGGFALTERYFL